MNMTFAKNSNLQIANAESRVDLINSIYILSGHEKHFARRNEWVRIERGETRECHHLFYSRYHRLDASRKFISSWYERRSNVSRDNLYVPHAISHNTVIRACILDTDNTRSTFGLAFAPRTWFANSRIRGKSDPRCQWRYAWVISSRDVILSSIRKQRSLSVCLTKWSENLANDLRCANEGNL